MSALECDPSDCAMSLGRWSGGRKEPLQLSLSLEIGLHTSNESRFFYFRPSFSHHKALLPSWILSVLYFSTTVTQCEHNFEVNTVLPRFCEPAILTFPCSGDQFCQLFCSKVKKYNSSHRRADMISLLYHDSLLKLKLKNIGHPPG